MVEGPFSDKWKRRSPAIVGVLEEGPVRMGDPGAVAVRVVIGGDVRVTPPMVLLESLSRPKPS